MPTAPSSARSGVAGVGGGGGGGRRSTFDRVMEYIVGDGPDNKFALICSFCLNHNGMALKEEFQYVGKFTSLTNHFSLFHTTLSSFT